MYLFTRSVTLSGSLPRAMAYAVDIRGHVADVLGRDIGLWSVGFGAPLGTVVFSARTEGLADLAAVNATLMADQAYLDRLEGGAEFRGAPGSDSLGRPLNGELGDDDPPVGAVAVYTSAIAAGGHMTDAVAWGIEVAEHAAVVGGVQVLVMAPSFGEFGQLGWLSVAADAAAAQASLEAVAADEGYIKMINDAGDLFVPGTGHRMMSTRIA